MIRFIAYACQLLAVLSVTVTVSAETAAPNVLLITADDLNCDSVGAFGATLDGTTPNLDRLATEGMRFERAHVTIAVCQPCRSVWMTGRYPHRSGGEGFHRLRKPSLPILPGELREAGYLVGILGKVGHSTPYADFRWDLEHDQKDLGRGRSPERYAHFARQLLSRAKADGKPFFLMANAHDPHRPFHGNDRKVVYRKQGDDGNGASLPSRVFRPAEVPIPGFLPDLPQVRREIAEYYSSVRRLDDVVGALLRTLDDLGLRDGTLVIFLSDHGMALPFSKTNCFYHSTRTPLIVRWPGVARPGSVNGDDFVSGIDLLPTLLAVAERPSPAGIDGRSFVPLLKGEQQDGRDRVFTQFHETAGKRRYPMRCVQDSRYAYIFNAWSDGTRRFRNESQGGRTMKAMQAAAINDPALAARVQLFLYRVPEELYDIRNDPDGKRNLIADPRHAKAATRLREELEGWMERTSDPALEVFRARENAEAVSRWMALQDAATEEARKKAAQARQAKKKERQAKKGAGTR